MLRAFPHLPVEEEDRLGDPRLREHFFERVFAYRCLRSLFGGRWTIGDLVAFHAAHGLQLMAHSPRRHAELRRLVAGAKARARPALRALYEAQFMTALEVMATPRRHVKVLRYLLDHLGARLHGAARRELGRLIADYGRGVVPLAVPIALVRHHVRHLAIACLQGQTYLEPPRIK